MNIVMVTNTYIPHVGGVARSVQAFAEEYRRRGHRVLIIAPDFPDVPKDEVDVIRVPALQKFNASDFSVALPVPSGLTDILEGFRPDIIHSQHPFLLGMTALRLARYFDVPLVFTHHTLYEQYTHYVPGDSPTLKSFVIDLATHYANLSNQVFTPSESIRDLLLERGVTTPILVVPTGVQVEKFAHGRGDVFRQANNIPEDAFVVGHLGRLAPEKNLDFLARAVAGFLKSQANTYFLLVGVGPAEQAIRNVFIQAGLESRLIVCGILVSEQLADALNAMNVFAFASKSETQGMVLTEAMAAGLPVVALDASGVREVLRDQKNGRLLQREDITDFSEALEWVFSLPEEEMHKQINGARATAMHFSLQHSADTALACFMTLKTEFMVRSHEEEKHWEHVMAAIKAEWDVIKTIVKSGDEALHENLLGKRKDG